MKYKKILYNQLKNNIEPDCEDFYLCEIEEKAKKYDELIDYLKEQITLCDERIDFHKSEIGGVADISDDNRHLILIKKNKIRKESFEEILSKIEKSDN